ncbi:CHRD domain-containing protein [Kitasatospora sp. NPDC052896]|uniref:CHRD domain-containing protein n=1 Tax=Kitasatospora sp. NPDC052896 TaxID=3364061 RepID=UPI0037C65898
MSTLLNRRLMRTAVTMTVIGLGLAACQSNTTTGHGSGPSARAGASGAAVGGGMTQPGALRGMPAGSVTLREDSQGMLQAEIDVYGLTPGSAHVAAIEAPGGNVLAPAVRFGTFTADATGRAHTTLSAQQSGTLPAGSRFGIHLGTFGGDANRDPVAMELIGQSDELPTRIEGSRTLAFHPVSVDANGNDQGTLSGTERTVYDPAAHTLTVTVTAHGLTPGAHAAHIHLGSCQSQGGVKYMLADFQADSHGDITNETRAVTGVTSAPPSSGWYLNLHQGDMNGILSNGAPAPAFRPLLCADLGPIPTGTGVSGTAAPSTSSMAAMTPEGGTSTAPRATATAGR